MSGIELIERLALALAIGLLIGVERGWQEREAKDGGRAAGTRTYALIGLLGGLAAAAQAALGGFVLAAAIVAFAGMFVPFALREVRLSGGTSATSAVTGLVTFLLGALAVAGSSLVAGVVGVAATIVLAERQFIHAFVARLTWTELRSALLLLAMTFVLLPVLPDHTVDPWQALNPHQLWLMVVIIAVISYAGYICVRLLGERAGLVLAAAAGGLVSSTAVTLAYARLSKLHPQNAIPLAAGIAASWMVSLLRMSAIAGAISPALIGSLAISLGPPALVLGLVAAFFYRRTPPTESAQPLPLNDPFELREVLKFGLLLAAVSLLAKWSGAVGGRLSLYPLAAVSGLVDVDPITLAVAKLAGAGLPLLDAAHIILTAAAANLLCKTAVILVFGTGRLISRMMLASAMATAAAAAAFVVG